MRNDIKAFIGHIWKSNRMLIFFGMFFIAIIQLLLIYFNSTLDIAPMVEFMLSQLPPQMNEMFGEEILSQISVEGTIAFGLEHPLVITLFVFISMNIISKNISSGSSNHLMEIILAHPFKRLDLFNSLYVFALSIILLITFAAFTGAFLSVYFFHDLNRTIITNMIYSDINAFLLHAFIMSYTLFFCVIMKDITKAIRISAVITLVFYFIDIISELWPTLEFTRYFNFFSYFDPPSIMVGHDNLIRDLIVLLVCSGILYFVSKRKFLRKDIF